ncbi:MAG: DUF3108 domain-containing protein [Desulfobacterales bacterium]
MVITFLGKLMAMVIVSVLGTLVLSPTTLGSKMNLPFSPGETLIYEITWSGIPVGHGVLSVLAMQKDNESEAYHFELKVKTNSFFDSFYKVRDKISSSAASNLTRSYNYQKQQNGDRTKRDVVVEFDWENQRAGYSNFGRKKPPIDILPGTLDPLSTLYFARLQDFEKIEEIRVPVSDGKKCIIGIARIVKRESITIGSGDFDTYLLEPEIEEIRGVFDKVRDAKIRVWLTADSRKIPVKVESKVAIGYFMAELVSAIYKDH